MPGRDPVRREDALERPAADAEDGVIAQQRLDPEDHLQLGEVLVVELRPRLGVAPEDREHRAARDGEHQEPRRGALRGRPIALLPPGEEGKRDEPDREREHPPAGRRGDVDGDDQRDAEADGPPRDHGPVREQEAEAGEGAEVEVPREVVRVEQRPDVPRDRPEVGLVQAVDPGGPREPVRERRERRRRRGAEHHDDAPRRAVPRGHHRRGREHRRVHRPLEDLDHRRPRIERDRGPARARLAQRQEAALPDVGVGRRDGPEPADGHGHGLEQRVRREDAEEERGERDADPRPRFGAPAERYRGRAEGEGGHHQQDGQVDGADRQDGARDGDRQQDGRQAKVARGVGAASGAEAAAAPADAPSGRRPSGRAGLLGSGSHRVEHEATVCCRPAPDHSPARLDAGAGRPDATGTRAQRSTGATIPASSIAFAITACPSAVGCASRR